MSSPDFTAQFKPKVPGGFVAQLEAPSMVFLLTARYRGHPVYYYLQLPIIRQQAFKRKLKLGLPLRLAHEGTILACDYGTPSPTLQQRMFREYQVVSLPSQSKLYHVS